MTAPIPTRWHGERLRTPPARMRRLQRWLGIAIREDDADVVRLRAALRGGDPVADAFVAWSAEQAPGVGRGLFERAVEGGLAAVPEAPGSLRRWFEPLEEEPSWLDREALRLGCRTSWRVGPSGGTVLTAMALVGGYRSAAAVKPLAMTGALDRMVIRRIAETSRFVLDVVESETMGRRSAGFASACRVRLMHAKVRRSLARRPDWDEDAWGKPINQTDMAATGLEFSAVYLSGLLALGFRFTREERDAVMHLWRYVSHLMGTDPALVAHDYRDGLRQMFIHGLTNPHADDDSRALARALHELPERVAATPGEKRLARLLMRYRLAVSRYTLGDEAVDDVGLPREPLAPLFLGLTIPARFGHETLRRHSAWLHARAERRGLALQQEIVGRLVGERPVEYTPYAERAPGAPVWAA